MIRDAIRETRRQGMPLQPAEGRVPVEAGTVLFGADVKKRIVMRILFMLASGLFMLAPTPVAAWPVLHTYKSLMGKQVVQWTLSRAQGLLAIAKIEQFGKRYESAARKKQTIATKTAAARVKAFRNALVGHRVAQDKMAAFNRYGPPSRAPYGCCDQARAAEAVVAKSAVKKTRGRVYEAMSMLAAAPTPAATTPGDYARQEIMAMDPAVEEAATLLPDSGTIAIGDMEKARDMAVLLTDPEPPRTQALYGTDTAEGRRYAASRRVRQARLSIARHVVADHVARKAPTHDLSAWAQKMAVAGGKDQTAAAADIPSGRVSADTVLETLVAMRYASPNWAVNLHSLSTEGLLREIVMMEAVIAEQNRRKLKLLQQIALFEAQGVKE